MLNLKTILTAIAIFVLGGVIVLASEAWNPSWDPFQTKGNVIERALARTLQAQSLSADFLIKLSADLEGVEGNQTMALEARLKENISWQEEKAKANGQLDFLVLTEGASLSANLENILKDDGFYLKINTLPAILPLGIDATSFKGKWFNVDLAMLSQALGQPENQTLSKKQREKILAEILAVLKENPLFVIKETKEESFLVEVDKEMLKKFAPAFLEKMKQYIVQQSLNDYNTSINQSLADFSLKVDDFWQKTGGIEFEAFIKNGYLVKVKWQKDINLKDYLSYQIEDKIKGGNINLSMELNLSDFNKTFQIQAPPNATPLEDLIIPLLSSMSGIMPGDFSQFDIPGLDL